MADRMTRDAVQAAFIWQDKGLIAKYLKDGAPLEGYELGYNLLHMSVLTGESAVVRLTWQVVGLDCERLSTRKSVHQQTPMELAESLGMEKVVDTLLELSSSRTPRIVPKTCERIDPVRAAMPIEQELEEERLDAIGRRNQQVLSNNANGRTHWTG